MRRSEIEERLAELREELMELESSRPAHSRRVEMETRIEQIQQEIAWLEALPAAE